MCLSNALSDSELWDVNSSFALFPGIILSVHVALSFDVLGFSAAPARAETMVVSSSAIVSV